MKINKANKSNNFDIFLSYAQKDTELFEHEYVDQIKRHIESSINDCIVFRDTQALEWGDVWNTKIHQKLKDCKVLIFLISDNYLASDYCTREWFWWHQEELSRGSFRGNTLPVYYIELSNKLISDSSDSLQLKAIGELIFNQTAWLKLNDTKYSASHIINKLNAEQIIAKIEQKLELNRITSNSFNSIPVYNRNFVGRIPELSEIDELCSSNYPIITARSGEGKSEIAFAYSHGYSSQYPQGRFIIPMTGVNNWEDALKRLIDQYGTLNEQLIKVQDLLHITDNDLKKDSLTLQRQIFSELYSRAQKGCLLIVLDNLEDESLLSEPGLKKFSLECKIPNNIKIIATAIKSDRIALTENSRAQYYSLSSLDDAAALELLRQYCRYSDFNVCVPCHNDKEANAAKEIIYYTEGHAWSLEIIGGRVGQNYQKGYNYQIALEELKQKFQISQSNLTFRNNPNSDDLLLDATLQYILKLPYGEAALELAAVASLFAPNCIIIAILKEYWNRYFYSSYKDIGWDNVKEILKDYHIFKEINELGSMHRLTIAVLQKKNKINLNVIAQKLAVILDDWKENNISEISTNAMTATANLWLDAPWRNPLNNFLLYHLPILLGAHYKLDDLKRYLTRLDKEKTRKDDEYKDCLFTHWGDYYLKYGDYEKSLKFFKKSLNIINKNKKSNQENIARVNNNIGNIFAKQSKFKEAIKFHQKALNINKKLYLLEPNLLLCISYENTGNSYAEDGQFKKALPLLEEALSIAKKVLKNRIHPDIAKCYTNLGCIYMDMNEFKKALRYHKTAQRINSKFFNGKYHPEIASNCSNLGVVYEEMCEYDRAEKYHKKALEIMQEAYKTDIHPNIAKYYANLGSVMQSAGKIEDAFYYFIKSLKLYKVLFEENNRKEIADAYSYLGENANKREKYQKALYYHNKSLYIYLDVFNNDSNHDDIALSYYNIAKIYYNMNEFKVALPFFQKSLKILNSIGSYNESLYGSCLEDTQACEAQILQAKLLSKKYEQLIGKYDKNFKLSQYPIAEKLLNSYLEEVDFSINEVLFYKFGEKNTIKIKKQIFYTEKIVAIMEPLNDSECFIGISLGLILLLHNILFSAVEKNVGFLDLLWCNSWHEAEIKHYGIIDRNTLFNQSLNEMCLTFTRLRNLNTIDNEKKQAIDNIILLAIEFICFHEIAHFSRNHKSFMEHEKNEKFNFFNELSLHLSFSQRHDIGPISNRQLFHGIEFDSDRQAVIMSFMLYEFMQEDNQIIEDEQVCNNITANVMHELGIAIGSLFLLLDHGESLNDLKYNTHPPSYIRLFEVSGMLSTYCKNVYGIEKKVCTKTMEDILLEVEKLAILLGYKQGLWIRYEEPQNGKFLDIDSITQYNHVNDKTKDEVLKKINEMAKVDFLD